MKIITADISASQYISQFRDVDKFIGFCRQCGNYGNSWLCPPFDYDIDEKLRPWTKVHVAGVTVDVAGKHQLSEAMALLQPARIELSRYLLEKEQESRGLAFGFSGKCHYCKECGRPKVFPAGTPTRQDRRWKHMVSMSGPRPNNCWAFSCNGAGTAICLSSWLLSVQCLCRDTILKITVCKNQTKSLQYQKIFCNFAEKSGRSAVR